MDEKIFNIPDSIKDLFENDGLNNKKVENEKQKNFDQNQASDYEKIREKKDTSTSNNHEINSDDNIYDYETISFSTEFYPSNIKINDDEDFLKELSSFHISIDEFRENNPKIEKTKERCNFTTVEEENETEIKMHKETQPIENSLTKKITDEIARIQSQKKESSLEKVEDMDCNELLYKSLDKVIKNMVTNDMQAERIKIKSYIDEEMKKITSLIRTEIETIKLVLREEIKQNIIQIHEKININVANQIESKTNENMGKIVSKIENQIVVSVKQQMKNIFANLNLQ